MPILKKSKIGKEDIFFDVNGAGTSVSVPTSNDETRTVKALNAEHLPVRNTLHDKPLYDEDKVLGRTVNAVLINIQQSLAKVTKFSNELVLSRIFSYGSGAIITDSERDKLNRLNDLGSGSIITAAERTKLNLLTGLTSTQIATLSAMVGQTRVGELFYWPTETPPAYGLVCNGDAVSRSIYADLFGIIGTTYGDGDGVTTFNLPDPQGRAIRCWDPTKKVDVDADGRGDRGDGVTGNRVGSPQADDIKAHAHDVTTYSHEVSDFPNRISSNDTGGVLNEGAASTNEAGGSETRMANMAFMLCIRIS